MSLNNINYSKNLLNANYEAAVIASEYCVTIILYLACELRTEMKLYNNIR